jgi:hypothetical protein
MVSSPPPKILPAKRIELVCQSDTRWADSLLRLMVSGINVSFLSDRRFEVLWWECSYDMHSSLG